MFPVVTPMPRIHRAPVTFRTTFWAAALCLAIPFQAAHAAASQWKSAEGGRVRLVTSGRPDNSGILKGALQIELKPGWETYWRDPGDTGVPPQIDLAGSSNATLEKVGYPAPERFRDKTSAWAGYDRPVSFALTLRVATPGKPVDIAANVFLGVCRQICIPLQARLTLDPALDADDPAAAGIVQDAFAGLPAPASQGFGVRTAAVDKDALTVRVALPDANAPAQLFLAAPEGAGFGAPKESGTTPEGASFAAPIYNEPDRGLAGASVAYTLVQGAASVDGTFQLP